MNTTSRLHPRPRSGHSCFPVQQMRKVKLRIKSDFPKVPTSRSDQSRDLNPGRSDLRLPSLNHSLSWQTLKTEMPAAGGRNSRRRLSVRQ